MKFMKTFEPVALLGMRWALALIFLAHGYPKLVHPNDAMREFFIAHGLPGYFLGVSGILECFGALLLIVGLFTRPAALLLTMEIAVAIWKVHSAHGIMVVRDYEFPLTVGFACFVLATIGAGSLSIDSLLFGEGGKRRRATRSTRD